MEYTVPPSTRYSANMALRHYKAPVKKVLFLFKLSFNPFQAKLLINLWIYFVNLSARSVPYCHTVANSEDANHGNSPKISSCRINLIQERNLHLQSI